MVCFSLPGKQRIFCVLGTFLKCRILKKKNSKKHLFESKIFSKKHDFEWKSFCKKHDFECKIFSKEHDFEWKRIARSMILNWKLFILSDLESPFYNASDFVFEFLQRVRFGINLFTTRQILN